MDYEIFPKDFLDTFDADLQEFYHRVVLEETSLDIPWRARAVEDALTEVVKAYKKATVSKGDSSIRFDNVEKRCAYVLKHSTCFTSAVANYMLKFVKCGDNKDTLFKILGTGRLNICCLGGGPASDCVAVIKIIQRLYHSIWCVSGRKLEIHVTVVDISRDWRKTAVNVMKCLKRTANFFDRNKLTLTYSFIAADLTHSISKEVKEILKEADIVSLVYFLSAVNGSNVRSKGLPMLQSIMENMKKGAILFFLDSAADQHYKMVNKAAEKCPAMKEIYGPLVEELHTISLDSVRKFAEIHARHFDTFFCLTKIFLSVSLWHKGTIAQPRIETALKLISWKTPSQKESDELTKKMRAYQAKVKKVVQTEYFRIRTKST